MHNSAHNFYREPIRGLGTDLGDCQSAMTCQGPCESSRWWSELSLGELEVQGMSRKDRYHRVLGNESQGDVGERLDGRELGTKYGFVMREAGR